jgi:hypothetical protein
LLDVVPRSFTTLGIARAAVASGMPSTPCPKALALYTDAVAKYSVIDASAGEFCGGSGHVFAGRARARLADETSMHAA